MANITSCCLALSLLLKDKVYFPGNEKYTASLESYFSLQETALRPSCIVSPQTVQDVSAAVRILVPDSSSDSGCQFAVRSGGHASFAGAANIQGGVTMDLTALNSITLDQSMPPVVSVGTGASWGDVYSRLAAVNLSVNGGRNSGPGVGGLTIGGGISYSGPRFGWTCDTALNFEVVLANGSIVNANNNAHNDLQWALRGGINNFGIVTRVDLQTFTQTDLWGGQVIHPISTVDEQIAALVEFNNPASYDDFSSLITTFGYSGAQNLTAIANNMEYTKAVMNPPVFSTLLSLASLSNTQRITNMTDLLKESDAQYPEGVRSATATVTIESTINAINASVRAWNESLSSIQNVPGIVWALGMDPLPPTLYARQAEANSLGLTDRQGKTLIVVQLTATWSNAEDDVTIDTASKALITTIQWDVGRLDALDPFIYPNYAAPWQDPIASYGEARTERLRMVRQEYDPRHVFTNIVPGGFKLPKE